MLLTRGATMCAHIYVSCVHMCMHLLPANANHILGANSFMYIFAFDEDNNLLKGGGLATYIALKLVRQQS